MKGEFKGSLFGAAVWVLASKENISATKIGGRLRVLAGLASQLTPISRPPSLSKCYPLKVKIHQPYERASAGWQSITGAEQIFPLAWNPVGDDPE
jgi:hypothetical protein